MKEVYKIVLPIFILILTSCSVQWRPVYLPSTPQNTYNKKLVSFSAGGLFSEGNSLNVSLGYQNRDLFFSAQYYQTYASKYESYVYQTYTSEYYESYGLGIYAIKNFWLKVDKYEYPWANFFVGVQPLLVHFLYKKEYKIYFYKEEYEDYYFPIELNIGFRPGIYRDNYNLNLHFKRWSRNNYTFWQLPIWWNWGTRECIHRQFWTWTQYRICNRTRRNTI
jgi:hypothetical protein